MVTTVTVRCLNQRHRQFCLTLRFTGYWNWICIWKKIIFVFCHKRYIPTAAAFGGLCIGALSVLADFMGEFIEFNLYPPLLTGLLVLVLVILCFHCHTIKDKKCKPFNTEIENRRNKRRASPKIRFMWYYTCEIFGRMFCPNLQSFVGRQQGAQIWRLETNKNYVFKGFFYKSGSTSLEELKKIKVIFILRQRMFR